VMPRISSSGNGRPIEPTMSRPILLIEDNPEDAEMMLRALDRAGVRRDIVHCSSGDEALSWLEGAPEEPHELPALVLLDLNLPGSDGKEILRELRGRPALSMLPVVVITSSRDESDVRACYRLGIQGYVQKPMRYIELQDVAVALKMTWFDHGVLPPRQRPTSGTPAAHGSASGCGSSER
jgi:CheY-like chemotaxis protein